MRQYIVAQPGGIARTLQRNFTRSLLDNVGWRVVEGDNMLYHSQPSQHTLSSVISQGHTLIIYVGEWQKETNTLYHSRAAQHALSSALSQGHSLIIPAYQRVEEGDKHCNPGGQHQARYSPPLSSAITKLLLDHWWRETIIVIQSPAARSAVPALSSAIRHGISPELQVHHGLLICTVAVNSLPLRLQLICPQYNFSSLHSFVSITGSIALNIMILFG